MDQFAPYLNNIMQSIILGVQNRREDEATLRGYMGKGYTQIQPRSEYQRQTAGPQNEAERQAFVRGPSAQEWGLKPPDVSVGSGGLFGMPRTGLRKPEETTYDYFIEKKKGREFLVMRDSNKHLQGKPTPLSTDKSSEDLKKGKPFNAVVNGKTKRVVPWYSTEGKLHHITELGTPYIKSGSGKGGANVLKNKQAATLKEMNAILSAHKLPPLNLVSLAGMKADERKKFMASFTKDAKSRLSGMPRKRYEKLNSNLQRITDELAGIKPLKLTPEITEDYLRRANNDPAEAERMAIEDGYTW